MEYVEYLHSLKQRAEQAGTLATVGNIGYPLNMPVLRVQAEYVEKIRAVFGNGVLVESMTQWEYDYLNEVLQVEKHSEGRC